MTFLRVVARRLLSAIPLLFIVSAFTFVLVSLVPGDPARVIVGEHATQDQYLAVRQQLGLNQSLAAQYWHWLNRLFHGDLGTSLFSGDPVSSTLNGRLPVTLSLIISATVVSGLLGVGLGVLSARRGGALVKVVDVLSVAGLAVPSFWFALVLIELFSVKIRLFPVTGFVPLTQDPAQWARALALPVATVSLGAVAIIAKQTRDSVLDTFNKDFIRVMQANGFSQRSILYRHVLKNAAIPVVTLLGIIFISLLSAAVFVETVFALPGLGQVTQQAALQHDVPLIQGAVLYIAVLVIIANTLTDLAYGWLDPRVRPV